MKKLKTPLKQSQRDGRWANVLLGYNTSQPYTIGNYGCLITCFANYIGKTPTEVNKILKANQGFVNGGLFVWSKSTALGLKEVYCSPRYEDAVSTQGLNKMRQLIDEGRPLITEIDFNPATTQKEMHFILIIGYDNNDVFYALDPWTGEVINLDVYGGVKRAVYQFRAYDKILPFDTGEDYFLGIDLNNKESIKVCVATWKDVVDGKYVKKEDYEKAIKEKETYYQNELSKKDQTINNLNQQINSLNAINTTLNNEKSILANKEQECLKVIQEKEEQYKKLNEELLATRDKVVELEKMKDSWQIKEGDYLRQLKTLQTKYEATKSSIKKLLIDYIFGKIKV